MKKGLIGLAIAFLFVLWVLAIKMDTKKGEQLRSEYRLVMLEENVNGVITSLKKIKGGCFIKFNDISIRLPSSQNYLYDDEYMHNNVFVGDSIVKNAYSDTIYIFSPKGGVKYFVQGEVVNRE